MASKRPPLHQAPDIHELLMQSKATQPATREQLQELQRISMLDVSRYSEADVRAEVIDPVVRILGYQKDTYFSLQREKPLKVLDGDLSIDYNMTLWTEAFWVIEAKKVKRKPLKFITSELQQALQYAVHPEINAALVVLCDGRVFEVYDREESVTKPAARVEVKHLPEQFQVLQALLAPWQSWFFQKRRVLRLVDKVLDYEINPGRLEEFKLAVERRIQMKRGRVIANWRKIHPNSNDRNEREAALRNMPIKDLIEAEFFVGFTEPDMHAIAKVLVEKAPRGAFEVVHQILPDHPRDMNDHFVGAALRTLIEFDASGSAINWFPTWLGAGIQGDGLTGAIKRLIALGLTTFDGDPSRKMVLQYSACARRIAKLSMALLPTLAQTGEIRHELVRYAVEELHEAQYMSTPSGHNFATLDGIQAMMTHRFVSECQDNRENFINARAETKLRDLWQLENGMLRDGTEYWKGLAGRGVEGELNPTERNWVDYDNLGHLTLCVLAASSQKWTEYASEVHASDLRRLAHGGSWQARKLLGINIDTYLPRPSDQKLAERFFFGNVPLFQDLRRAYASRPLA
jgi:hypothetical protein